MMIAYKHMFQEGSGGKSAVEWLRKELFSSQGQLQKENKFDKNNRRNSPVNTEKEQSLLML